MKPANFPARRLARQLAADVRRETGPGTWPRRRDGYISATAQEFADTAQVEAARSVRTKKDRRSHGLSK